MKRKINLSVRIVLLSVCLMLFGSNVHAFLVSSEFDSLTIQLVPAVPNSNMAIEWTGYSASATATAYQQSGRRYHQNRSGVSMDDPSMTSVAAATEDGRITIDMGDRNASFAADFGEDTSDYLKCFGNWNLRRDFTIQGDGWLLISAVHSAEYEDNPSFELDYSSFAGLHLRNFSSYGDQWTNSHFHENSSELNDILGVGYFFNDGDMGYLSASLSDYYSNSEITNIIPIPSAVWLFVCGLSCLAAVRKGSR